MSILNFKIIFTIILLLCLCEIMTGRTVWQR